MDLPSQRGHCGNFELKDSNKRYLLYVKCLVLVYSLNGFS